MTRILVRSRKTGIIKRFQSGVLRRYQVTKGELGIAFWSVDQRDSSWMLVRILWDFDAQHIPTRSGKDDFEVIGLVIEGRRIHFDEIHQTNITPFSLC